MIKFVIYACITLFVIDINRTIQAMEEQAISITHLLETNEMPTIQDDGTLDLEGRNITSLNGLEKVPRQQEILNLNLSHNHLRRLPPSLFPHLTQLDLSHNALKQIPAEMLEGLVLLKQFIAHSAQIEEIPPHFFDNLPRLSYINLSNNLLTSLHSELFYRARALKRLSLTNNKLTTLHPLALLHQSKLTSLSLGGNQLKTIPPQLCNSLKQLKILELWENELESFKPGTFNSLGRLKRMCLSHNNIHVLQPELFRHCTSLVELNLGYNKLTSIPPDLLTILPTLQSLNLRGNCSEIIKNLPQKSRDIILKNEIFIGDPKLHFDDEYQPKTLDQLCKQLAEQQRLHEMFIEVPHERGGIIINISHRGLKNIEGLDELLPNPNQVIGIFAQNNYLEEMPCTILNKFNFLRTLDLQDNHITSLTQPTPLKEHPSTTMQTLSLPALRVLLLANNTIQTISQSALSLLTKLSILQLSNNKIDVIEAGAFNQLENLESCLLNNNKLDGIPHHLFAARKANFPRLAFIDLSRNALGSYDQYRFPQLTTVSYSLQNAQPLQLIAAQQLSIALKQKKPIEKLALIRRIPRHVLSKFAPESMRRYLLLCTHLDACDSAFDALNAQEEKFDYYNKAQETWFAAITCLDNLQWETGVSLFLEHFNSHPLHQKFLQEFCIKEIEKFRIADLKTIAEKLFDLSPSLRILIIDNADKKLQIRITGALEVYGVYLYLTQNWAKKIKTILYAHNKMNQNNETLRVEIQDINNEWYLALEKFKKESSAWSTEMRQAIFELLPEKCKRDIVKYGIIF